jgi:hypothetical protein
MAKKKGILKLKKLGKNIREEGAHCLPDENAKHSLF